MPRPLRGVEDAGFYHVLNRGNGRMKLFHKPEDFSAFCKVLCEALARYPVNLFSWCLMDNHWHLVLQPARAEALPDLMRWVGVTHVRRHHAHFQTRGGGHLYQGRYKNFAIQDDEHFLTVCRYVEANPLRAGLVPRAQDWPWSSLGRGDSRFQLPLSRWPLQKPHGWARLVNESLPKQSIESLRTCIKRGQPFGDEAWMKATAKRLNIVSTIRSIGRPRIKPKAAKGVVTPSNFRRRRLDGSLG
jgi:putative transposase